MRAFLALTLCALLLMQIVSYGNYVFADQLPSGTTVSSGPYPSDFQTEVIVLSDPNMKNITFQTPPGSVAKIFSTVTSYVQGAVLYFDSGGSTYSISISPNSNTILTFSSALSISNVRITIDGRGYPDDAVHFGYLLGQSSSQQSTPSDSLPAGASKTTSSSYPTDFQTEVVVLSDPNLKTINFSSPGHQVTKIFSTVTTYVQNAVLYFDSSGTTYSLQITPNSNTIVTFSSSLSISNVKIKIDGRGYSDDAVHFGYYPKESSPPPASTPADSLPSGASKTTGNSYPSDFETQVVVLSDPNLKTISFNSPADKVSKLFSTVTSYVQSAVLYFDVGGSTYAVNISPNSNTIITFQSALTISNVKMTIQGRGYSDDAVHAGYLYPPPTSSQSDNLPSGTTTTSGNSYPPDFQTQVVVLSDPNLKTINFQAPSSNVAQIFSTVTTYVENAVLLFDSGGTTYSKSISPNSNTIIKLANALSISNVKMTITTRGYPDDAVHFGYLSSTPTSSSIGSFSIQDVETNKGNNVSFSPGESVSLYVDVKNTGSTSIDSYCLNAKIVAKDASGNVILSGEGWNVNPVSSGNTRLIGFNTSIPSGATGWHSLEATVIPLSGASCGELGSTKTYQQSNSFQVVPVTPPEVPSLPDLYVERVYLEPGNRNIGLKEDIVCHVRNLGVKDATSFYTDFYVDGVKVQTKQTDGISLKGEKLIKANGAWIKASGSHTFMCIVDSTNSVNEGEFENNNTGELRLNDIVAPGKLSTALTISSSRTQLEANVASYITISGKLVDSNGKGIAGKPIVISVYGQTLTATTDGNGSYSANPLVTISEVGNWSIEARFYEDESYKESYNNVTVESTMKTVQPNESSISQPSDSGTDTQNSPNLLVHVIRPLISSTLTPYTTTGIPRTDFLQGESITSGVNIFNTGQGAARDLRVAIYRDSNVVFERTYGSLEPSREIEHTFSFTIGSPGKIEARVSYLDENGDRHDKSDVFAFTVVRKTYIVYDTAELNNNPNIKAEIDRLALLIEKYHGIRPDAIDDTRFSKSNVFVLGPLLDLIWTPIDKNAHDLILVGSPSTNELVAEFFPELFHADARSTIGTTVIKIDEDLGVTGNFVFSSKNKGTQKITLISAPNHTSLEFMITHLIEPSLKIYAGYDIASSVTQLLDDLPEDSFDKPVDLWWVSYLPFYACKIGDKLWCLFDVGTSAIPVGTVIGKSGGTASKVVVKAGGKWVGKEVGYETLSELGDVVKTFSVTKAGVTYKFTKASYIHMLGESSRDLGHFDDIAVKFGIKRTEVLNFMKQAIRESVLDSPGSNAAYTNFKYVNEKGILKIILDEPNKVIVSVFPG